MTELLLIRLTHPEGHEIVLLAHHIEMMRAAGPTEIGHTCIYVHGDPNPYVVKELLNQVLMQFPGD